MLWLLILEDTVTMTWFKPYKLFLTKDKRTDIFYNYFVADVSKNQKHYILTLKLWDLLSRAWLEQEVMLVKVGEKDKNIMVEVSDAVL